MSDSINQLDHLADAITAITGDDDREAVEADAWVLMVRFPELADPAEQWAAGQITFDDFTAVVRTVLDTVNVEAWLAQAAETAGPAPF